MTPKQYIRWELLYEDLADATGDEPLSYTYCSSGCNVVSVPNPFRSANDDYFILQHVREEWDPDAKRRFKLYLSLEGIDYRPGVYTVAACQVKQREKTDAE